MQLLQRAVTFSCKLCPISICCYKRTCKNALGTIGWSASVPTLSGEAVLTPFHQYGTVRHLQDKPVAKFTDRDQFLLIAAAEKEGLLKVHFKVTAFSRTLYRQRMNANLSQAAPCSPYTTSLL